MIIRNLNNLDSTSRKILLDTLMINNFRPEVSMIKKIKMTGDGIEWHLGTKSGSFKILTVSRKNVIKKKNGNIILVDEFNTPYEINPAFLDERSKKLIGKIV